MKLVDQKSKYRHPKQARSKIKFNRILDYTESLLDSGKLKSINLNDIADDMDIAVGSVYHFFPSKNSLLLAMADRFLDVFTTMIDHRNLLLNENINSWQDYFRDSAQQVITIYNTSKPASILLLGQAYNWQIRLADAAAHRRMAKVLAETFNKISDFSFIPNLEEMLLNSIVILAGFWHRSYEENEKISNEYFEVSIEAAIAYLEHYFPKNLALKNKQNSNIVKHSQL